MKLADAMNTYNPALEIIVEKGYKIKIVDNEDSFDWKAIKCDNEFIASDPLRLLGIINLHEEKGTDWNSFKKDYYNSFLEKAYGEKKKL